MKRVYQLLVLVIIVMGTLVACGNNEDQILENPEYSGKSDDLINEGISEFSFDIFKEINKGFDKDNVFISPYSIAAALGMTYNGAGGVTKLEMAKVLHVDNISDVEFNEGHKFLYSHMNDLSGVEVNTNNAIWANKGFEIKEEFINRNIEVFDAYIDDLDFSKNSSVSKMNGWIEDNTNGLITDMINSPIDVDTQMILVNTVYFNGDWVNDFREDYNRDRMFNNSNGTTSSITMMTQKNNFLYTSQEEYKMIQLPYEGKDVSMYGILPEGDMTIKDLANSLNSNVWEEMKSQLNLTDDVLLNLPKFKLEFGVEELNNALIQLGMVSAFSSGEADLSGIAEGLFISSIRHKAIIEVDETGTEAAAATVEETKEEAMEEMPIFNADRPFIIIIEDHETDTILFIGKIEKF